MDGEHNIGLDWTLEYLKKLEIVFQQGTVPTGLLLLL